MRALFYGFGLLLTLAGLLPLPHEGYNLTLTVVSVYRFLPQNFDMGLLPFAVLPLGLVGLVLAAWQRPAAAGPAKAAAIALVLAFSLYGLMATILSLLFPLRIAPAPEMERVATAYAVCYAAWVVCALAYLGEYVRWIVRKEVHARDAASGAVPASTL